ncbi:ABC transporter permease subunit [uncultured Roseobacter sp.]|uniref:ABC transporter permease n=1 Tax=uncultured Roseobacter sp. TaxID=114847 RepID=UPI002601AC16|nr:ABC transporter permease subunit [uncultured Roseobacter sp.]
MSDAPISARVLRFLGTLMAVLLAWQFAATLLAGSFLFAGPIEILRYLLDNHAVLGRALLATVQTAALGYLWGNAVAILLAGLALLLPLSERPIRILSLVVFCLPLIATGPILRVLYGPGIGPQVTLAALSVFYTTLVPLLAGLRAVPRVWVDMVQSYGRGRWTTLAKVRVLASTPYLIAGLQIAAPAAFLGALIGEFTGAERGLGILTLQAMRRLDTDATWAIASIAAVTSISVYLVIGKLGRLLWKGAPTTLLAPPLKAPRRHWLRSVAGVLGLTLMVLLLWQGVMDVFGLNRFFAKRPDDIWSFLVTGTEAEAHRETLLSALGDTLITVVPGFFAGLALGGALAALCTLMPRMSGVLLPVAITLRAVPIVTTAPLIVLWLGRGPTGVITIVAIMIFFPTLIACLHGLKQVPKAVLDVCESYSAPRWRILVHARIPAALPAFFATARIAVPAAVLAATVAEWLATGQGMGHLMALAASTSDYNMLWSAVVALTLVAVIAHFAVALAEQVVFARYAPEQLQP